MSYLDDPFDAAFVEQVIEHEFVKKGLPSEYAPMARDAVRKMAGFLSGRDIAVKVNADFVESVTHDNERLKSELAEVRDEADRHFEEVCRLTRTLGFWRSVPPVAFALGLLTALLTAFLAQALR